MTKVVKKNTSTNEINESVTPELMSFNISGRADLPNELEALISGDAEIQASERSEKLKIYQESPMATIDARISSKRESIIREYLKRRDSQPELIDIPRIVLAKQNMIELLEIFENFAQNVSRFNNLIQRYNEITEVRNLNTITEVSRLEDDKEEGKVTLEIKLNFDALPPEMKDLTTDLRIEYENIIPIYQRANSKINNLHGVCLQLYNRYGNSPIYEGSFLGTIANQLKKMTSQDGDQTYRARLLATTIEKHIDTLHNLINVNEAKFESLISAMQHTIKLFGQLPNEFDPNGRSRLKMEALKHLEIVDQEMHLAISHSRQISSPFQLLCALCHFYSIDDSTNTNKFIEKLKNLKIKKIEQEFERIRKSGDYPPEVLNQVIDLLAQHNLKIKMRETDRSISTLNNPEHSIEEDLNRELGRFLDDQNKLNSIKWALKDLQDPIGEVASVVNGLEETLGNPNIVRGLISVNPELLLLRSSDPAKFGIYCAWLEIYLPVMVRMIEQGQYKPTYFASLESLHELWKSVKEEDHKVEEPTTEEIDNLRSPREARLLDMISNAGYDYPEIAYSIIRYGLYWQGKYLTNTDILPSEFNRQRILRCFSTEAKPTPKQINHTLKQLSDHNAIIFTSAGCYVLNHKTKGDDAPKGVMRDVITQILDPNNKPGPIIKFTKHQENQRIKGGKK